MKKAKIAVGKKNSKPAAAQTVTEIKITEDTTCVVTYVLPGAFASRQSNASTKEEIWKMKLSPFIEENKKGIFLCAYPGAKGRKLDSNRTITEQVPNYYTGSTEYKPCKYHKCYKRQVYSAESLSYLSSEEARPFGFTKKQWDDMSIKARLEAQFAIDAVSLNSINPGFKFEFVN